jgi:uncharacterized protein YuzE
VRTRYDAPTDSLHLELRPLPVRRAVEVQEDVMADLGEDGLPVGYDIQHASTKRELIARLVLEEGGPVGAAAERSGDSGVRPAPRRYTLAELLADTTPDAYRAAAF